VTPVVLAATVPDAVTFALAAVICVVGSLGVVLSRNPVHSALNLVMTLFGVAVLFVELDAQFLAVVQVIVYAGAIVVLFLFVIMLLGVDRREAMTADPLKGQRAIAVLLGLLGIAEVIALARGGWPVGARTVSKQPVIATGQSNAYILGKSVFTTYLLAFEITSALLVIAVIGAVLLSRRPRRAGVGSGAGRPAAEGAEGSEGDEDDEDGGSLLEAAHAGWAGTDDTAADDQ
jgi:NADH-quinone oxidoreductase subunit J